MKSQRLLRGDAARIWNAALRAVDPEAAVPKLVKRKGRTLRVRNRRFDLGAYRSVWVFGAGKAASSMGRAVEKILGRYLSGGLVITKYGHGVPLKMLQAIEAGHPLPDANSVAGAAELIRLAHDRVGPEDLVICLFSGGASSLLVSPAQGISLEDKLACTRLLLNAGADIRELNAVRKHLSGIKGGRLARMLAPATVVALILSDVVGDDVGTIASGPLAPDAATFGDCVGILQKYQLWDRIPSAVKQRFEGGLAGSVEETPKEGDPIFETIESVIIGNNAQACTAAAQAARRLGYRPLIITSRLVGDNEAAARFHMSIAAEAVHARRPARPPCCIVSGGETTVLVGGEGKGGRNQEFVLHCVRPLAGLPAPCVVASVGTDGTDGPTDAAGAIADNASLSRSIKFGAQFLDEALRNNDSYNFFNRLGDLVVTGPTRTNVMDLHLILIG